jgi:hypothetical protein
MKQLFKNAVASARGHVRSGQAPIVLSASIKSVQLKFAAQHSGFPPFGIERKSVHLGKLMLLPFASQNSSVWFFQKPGLHVVKWAEATAGASNAQPSTIANSFRDISTSPFDCCSSLPRETRSAEGFPRPFLRYGDKLSEGTSPCTNRGREVRGMVRPGNTLLV